MILHESNEIIIVLGSSQRSHDLANPFTTGERITMVRAALNEMKVESSKYYLIPVPDSIMNSLWTAKVISYCPPFNLVYSNEPLTKRLFKEVGISVKGVPMFQREIYSATEIRRRILAVEDWEVLVPKSIVKIIKSIRGVERLQELAMTDSPSVKKIKRKREP
jgi:nicotinamide-nucleotide adenylyltransferase